MAANALTPKAGQIALMIEDVGEGYMLTSTPDMTATKMHEMLVVALQALEEQMAGEAPRIYAH